MLRLAGIDAAGPLAVDFLCGGVGPQEAAFRAAACNAKLRSEL
jgi:hypothetical protein